MSLELKRYGWTSSVEADFVELAGEGSMLGRVVLERRGLLRLRTAAGTEEAIVRGSLRANTVSAADLPTVGDWVVWGRGQDSEQAVIDSVLPRRTKISRKAAGNRSDEQVVAANVDVVVLVMGLDGDYNLRRLERFLVMAWDGGAQPAVVLNKSDLCDECSERLVEVEAVAIGVPVVVMSALEGSPAELEELLSEGETVVFVGSSGVGKSTILNALLGEDLMSTQAVREGDGRGRHTTTERLLVRLPSGALLIDGPGVREIQPWDADTGLDETFEDIRAIEAQCRFRDCSHEGEPGCAVQEALDSGKIEPGRLDSLRGLEREAAALERRRDVRQAREADRRTGKLYRSVIAQKRRSRGDF